MFLAKYCTVMYLLNFESQCWSPGYATKPLEKKKKQNKTKRSDTHTCVLDSLNKTKLQRINS